MSTGRQVSYLQISSTTLAAFRDSSLPFRVKVAAMFAAFSQLRYISRLKDARRSMLSAKSVSAAVRQSLFCGPLLSQTMSVKKWPQKLEINSASHQVSKLYLPEDGEGSDAVVAQADHRRGHAVGNLRGHGAGASSTFLNLSLDYC